MKKILLCALLLGSSCMAFSSTFDVLATSYVQAKNYILAHLFKDEPQTQTFVLSPLALFLHQQAPDMSMAVINKVSKAFECSQKFDNKTSVLTVIDYSLPSNQKRLWIFDLNKKALLFHTPVSHGLNSGELMTDYFSNVNNSKASSLGVYLTGAAYYGREGMSLRLDGLDKGFNDQASNRYIVMHGGWYVDDAFIKKYGRPGRSWGCPALPMQYSKDIIDTIKEKNLLVVYYPDDNWFAKSKYLNCEQPHAPSGLKPQPASAPTHPKRDPVLFTSKQFSRNPEENQVVLVLSADDYQKRLHKSVPLNRMLRRQINHTEYVALSPRELKTIMQAKVSNDKQRFQGLLFVTPVIKMVRGYYETLMQVRDFGQIEDIKSQTEMTKANTLPSYKVFLKGKPGLVLSPSEHFVRWLGL